MTYVSDRSVSKCFATNGLLSVDETYHNHLDMEEPEGLLVELVQHLLCFSSAHDYVSMT